MRQRPTTRAILTRGNEVPGPSPTRPTLEAPFGVPAPSRPPVCLPASKGEPRLSVTLLETIQAPSVIPSPVTPVISKTETTAVATSRSVTVVATTRPGRRTRRTPHLGAVRKFINSGGSR